MRTVCTLLLAMAMAMALGAAAAREPPATPSPAAASPVSPSPQQLEPAVDTTAATPSETPSGAAPTASRAPSGTRQGVIERGTAADGKAAAKTAARAPKGPDRVQLDTTDITGNRELPKVLYIVPWRHSDIGDLVGKPPKSLLDEVLEPIDRDVFLRENRYYDALKPGAAAVKPGATQGSDRKP
jgi:hypothetical protein